jgi:hypothetical protein
LLLYMMFDSTVFIILLKQWKGASLENDVVLTATQ